MNLVILDHFLPFYPTKTPQKSKFWKMKKFAGDIIILHMCTKNHNHMMNHESYSSWDTEWDTEFFVILGHFLPFYHLLTSPLMIPKIKILKKKWKKIPGDIILLDVHVYHKWKSYDIWFLKYKVRHVTYLPSHFHPIHLIYQSLSIHFMYQSPTHSFHHSFPSHSFYRS